MPDLLLPSTALTGQSTLDPYVQLDFLDLHAVAMDSMLVSYFAASGAVDPATLDAPNMDPDWLLNLSDDDDSSASDDDSVGCSLPSVSIYQLVSSVHPTTDGPIWMRILMVLTLLCRLSMDWAVFFILWISPHLSTMITFRLLNLLLVPMLQFMLTWMVVHRLLHVLMLTSCGTCACILHLHVCSHLTGCRCSWIVNPLGRVTFVF